MMAARLPIARAGVWMFGLLLVPLAAIAAQATLAADAGTHRFWAALGGVQILAGWGYGASSLAEWAQWVDDTGGAVAVAQRRLKLVQGVITAMLAGNAAYYGGYYYMGAPEIGCFIAAAVAAWGGDKFLSPLLTRITGKAQSAG